MQNKNFNSRWSYFSTPRKHGNVFAWHKPVLHAETSKPLTENIMRWEDDGGPVPETSTPLPKIKRQTLPS